MKIGDIVTIDTNAGFIGGKTLVIGEVVNELHVGSDDELWYDVEYHYHGHQRSGGIFADEAIVHVGAELMDVLVAL